jgi:AcrR family transcriptional regulator
MPRHKFPEGKEDMAPAIRARRKPDREGTREAILHAALEVLAEGGKGALSVAQVAHRAGVSRGTAHEHFQTRVQLLEATATWMTKKLCDASFGDPAVADDQTAERVSMEHLTHHLASLAMENPGLGRVWLFELMSSRRPTNDFFWRQYKTKLERFANVEFAQPGIDVEIAAVLTIAGCFLWPIWNRADIRSAKDRKHLAQRFAREIGRMCSHATMRALAVRDARRQSEL